MNPHLFDRNLNKGMTFFKFFFGFVVLTIVGVTAAQAYAIYYGVQAVGRGDSVCIDDHCLRYKKAPELDGGGR